MDRSKSTSFKLSRLDMALHKFKDYLITWIELHRHHYHIRQNRHPLQIKEFYHGCCLVAFAGLLISPLLSSHQLTHLSNHKIQII